jgi:hypothetical protein
METLLIIALFAAFGGFVVSLAAMYKLLFEKKG